MDRDGRETQEVRDIVLSQELAGRKNARRRGNTERGWMDSRVCVCVCVCVCVVVGEWANVWQVGKYSSPLTGVWE